VRNLGAVIGLAGLAAAGSLLGGCGGGQTSDSEASKSPSQILADAQRAVRNARSVHVTGIGVAQGQGARLDLSLVRGSVGTGKLRLFGGSVELVRIRDNLYMRGDRRFWRHFGQNPAKLALLSDRWVEAPSSVPALRGIASLTDISGLSSMLAEHGKVSNEGVRTFRGQKVVALHDATEGGTLYVRATGIPYPVAIVGGDKGRSETIVFDRWNRHVVVRAPKNPLSLGTTA
jgi:hypothetical protein